MVKCCAVQGCKSGRKSERKKNSDSNIRQTSLYKIPKDPNKLKKWSLGLCQDLVPEKYVCELHFHDKDILKHDNILLSNGIIHTLNRIKYTLKQDAIPILNNNNDSVQDVKFIPKIQENVNNVPASELFLNSKQQTCQEKNNIEEIDTLLTSCSTNVFVDIDQLSSSSQNKDSCLENDLIKFTNDDLIQILNTTMLPQKWSWASDVTDYQKIFLFFADPKSLALKFHIKIIGISRIEIKNMKTGMSTDLTFDLSSIDDFWNLLKQMENSHFCDGTGFDSKRCSTTCTNIFLPNKIIQQYKGMYRCLSCRALRRQLQNREHKLSKNLKVPYQKIKYELMLQKRKCSRLQVMNNELSQLINEQKSKGADVKTDAIEPAIADLPEIQQQAVRACEKYNSDDVDDNKSLNLKSNFIPIKESDNAVPSTKVKLKRIKLRDADNETFLCERCGKCYKTKYQLISHLKSHNNDKPFKCDECCKTYKNPAVHRHKLIHNGIKPFVCEICGKKFRLQGMLTMHSLIHTGVLPHECSYCKKRFRRIDFLKGHLRQHTGERPYSCTQCNHFFSNGSNFIKHLKVRHGLQNVSITNRFQFPFVDT